MSSLHTFMVKHFANGFLLGSAAALMLIYLNLTRLVRASPGTA
ncbi:hypothetical protein [Rhizobium setariae]|nr:hypothetical protein [Rhizobium setariae]